MKAVHRRPVGISGLVVDIVHATGLWNEESTLVKANEQDCMFLGYFAPKSTCSLRSPIHKATIDSSFRRYLRSSNRPGKTKFIIVKIYPDYPILYFPSERGRYFLASRNHWNQDPRSLLPYFWVFRTLLHHSRPTLPSEQSIRRGRSPYPSLSPYIECLSESQFHPGRYRREMVNGAAESSPAG